LGELTTLAGGLAAFDVAVPQQGVQRIFVAGLV